MEIKDNIKLLAIENALKFNGKANSGAIFGKILGTYPELKNNLSETKLMVDKILEEVNSMSLDSLKEEFERNKDLIVKDKKKDNKDKLKDLPNAIQGKVVTRMPPEPSKYNHLGHAMSFLINYIYAQRYDGKCILRFEDTNPEKESVEYVEAMMKDCIEYLDIKPSEIIFVSDHLNKFYEYAEILINEGKAYMCTCNRDTMSELRQKGEECEHRLRESIENMSLWKKMLNREFKEGEIVLRLKIDMTHDNYVMRDPVIFRIVYTSHYRQKDKYCVWPMYDFENAIEENLEGTTHVMRSNEFGNMRIELQNYIKDLFGFTKQTVIQYGRITVTDMIAQGREIREMIEKGIVTGWDDPRLLTLRALRRRGIKKETFYELVKEVGLSPSPTNIDWTRVSAINRRVVDKSANRYFFILNPRRIEIQNAPTQNVELNLNKEYNKGGRFFETGTKFIIEEKDYKQLIDGQLYRLMDCCNFVKTGHTFEFDSIEHEKYKQNGKKIIHWLPDDENQLVEVSIVMPDATRVKGYSEKSILKLNVDDVIQFERFGFVKLDKKEDVIEFYFSHE